MWFSRRQSHLLTLHTTRPDTDVALRNSAQKLHRTTLDGKDIDQYLIAALQLVNHSHFALFGLLCLVP